MSTKNNGSSEAQRRFIDALARGRKMDELETLLAPAFALHGNAFKACDTLNQNTARIAKDAASMCIDILKGL